MGQRVNVHHENENENLSATNRIAARFGMCSRAHAHWNSEFCTPSRKRRIRTWDMPLLPLLQLLSPIARISSARTALINETSAKQRKTNFNRVENLCELRLTQTIVMG